MSGAEFCGWFSKVWTWLCKLFRKDNTPKAQSIDKSIRFNFGTVIQVSTDLYDSNATKLLPEPQAKTHERIHEISQILENELKKRNPEAVKEFNEPALQEDLYKVLKHYALSGDKVLGELLIDILVERAGRTKKDIVQISLTEAIDILPKLTSNQIKIITLTWLLKPQFFRELKSYPQVLDYIENTLCPLAVEIGDDYPDELIQLEYLRCILWRPYDQAVPIEETIAIQCKTAFLNYFTLEEIDNMFSQFGSTEKFKELFTVSMFDSQKFQFKLNYEEILTDIVKELKIQNNENEIRTFIKTRCYMASTRIDEHLQRTIPNYVKVSSFAYHPNKEMTNVGIVIAQANLRRMNVSLTLPFKS